VEAVGGEFSSCHVVAKVAGLGAIDDEVADEVA